MNWLYCPDPTDEHYMESDLCLGRCFILPVYSVQVCLKNLKKFSIGLHKVVDGFISYSYIPGVLLLML